MPAWRCGGNNQENPGRNVRCGRKNSREFLAMLEGNRTLIEKADLWVHAFSQGEMVSWQYEHL